MTRDIYQTLCQMALQRQLFAALHNGQTLKAGCLAGLTARLILLNRLALTGKKCMLRLGLGALLPQVRTHH
ncbi:MAG: hypothetical protein ISQ29_02195 [Candidatus Puniceispirillum sp.]|nr:hypothetical protein [Candidatus Puniceispirillum sp.]